MNITFYAFPSPIAKRWAPYELTRNTTKQKNQITREQMYSRAKR